MVTFQGVWSSCHFSNLYKLRRFFLAFPALISPIFSCTVWSRAQNRQLQCPVTSLSSEDINSPFHAKHKCHCATKFPSTVVLFQRFISCEFIKHYDDFFITLRFEQIAVEIKTCKLRNSVEHRCNSLDLLSDWLAAIQKTVIRQTLSWTK